MRFSAFFLALALAAPARAQGVIPSGSAVAPAGDDVVHLKDGGMIRGTVLEILPNDHVTVQLANGQTAMIEWSHVAHVEQRGRPAPAPAAAAPKRTAFVHIESEQQVRLEAVLGRKDFRFVCTSPCDMEVDLDASYQIAGDGVRASRQFQLSAQQGQKVLIEVDPASKAGFVWGIVIVSVAPVVSLVGLVVYALSSDITSSSSGQTVGAAMGIGGLVGTVLGIVLIASNASSKTTQSTVGPQTPPPPRETSDTLRFPAPVFVTTPVLRF
jgi:hypothetical protein